MRDDSGKCQLSDYISQEREPNSTVGSRIRAADTRICRLNSSVFTASEHLNQLAHVLIWVTPPPLFQRVRRERIPKQKTTAAHTDKRPHRTIKIFLHRTRQEHSDSVSRTSLVVSPLRIKDQWSSSSTSASFQWPFARCVILASDGMLPRSLKNGPTIFLQYTRYLQYHLHLLLILNIRINFRFFPRTATLCNRLGRGELLPPKSWVGKR